MIASQDMGGIDRDRSQRPVDRDPFSRRQHRLAVGPDAGGRDLGDQQRRQRRHHQVEIGVQRKGGSGPLERAEPSRRL